MSQVSPNGTQPWNAIGRAPNQTYIQRLGFQDKDRSNIRHGLACEYLLERIAEIELLPAVAQAMQAIMDERVKDTAKENRQHKTDHDKAMEDIEKGQQQLKKAEEELALATAKPVGVYYKELLSMYGHTPAALRFHATMEKAERRKIEEIAKYERIINEDSWRGYGGGATKRQETADKLEQHKIGMSETYALWLKRKADAESFSPPPELLSMILSKLTPSNHINTPLTNKSFVNGFTDVYVTQMRTFLASDKDDILRWDFELGHSMAILGEVKITQESAESVLQQINFYLNYLPCVTKTYILIDYDDPQLARMTEGSAISVHRLGPRFEQWCATRHRPEMAEL